MPNASHSDFQYIRANTLRASSQGSSFTLSPKIYSRTCGMPLRGAALKLLSTFQFADEDAVSYGKTNIIVRPWFAPSTMESFTNAGASRYDQPVTVTHPSRSARFEPPSNVRWFPGPASSVTRSIVSIIHSLTDTTGTVSSPALPLNNLMKIIMAHCRAALLLVVRAMSI